MGVTVAMSRCGTGGFTTCASRNAKLDRHLDFGVYDPRITLSRTNEFLRIPRRAPTTTQAHCGEPLVLVRIFESFPRSSALLYRARRVQRTAYRCTVKTLIAGRRERL